MFDFLKTLIGSAPEKKVSLAFEDVPAFLDEKERQVKEILSCEVEEPMRSIKNASASLQLTVNTISGADQNPETHPRIKSITKNSLPLFIKAMNTSLAKELPDNDPEAFYTGAVENVKGCLNAVRGQGRYLQVAFPEEMKATKAGIDAVGHEINAMTKALGKYKKQADRIGAARAAHTALADAKKDRAHSFEKEERYLARISEISSRLDEIVQETARLQADPSLATLDEERGKLAGLAREREECLRRYTSLTMTMSHVFRKAEKIAAKKHLAKEVHVIRDAMELLSDHEVAAAEPCTATLATACPVVEKMVADGEIVLKNREERTVFAEPAKYAGEVSQLCARYYSLEKDSRVAEEGLLSHPVLSRLQALGREKEQLDAMRTREEQQVSEVRAWRSDLDASLPRLEEMLVKKMEEMAGETVQFLPADPV
jgi:hypothetical protein